MSEGKNKKIKALSNEDLADRIRRIGAEGTGSVYYKHLVAEKNRRENPPVPTVKETVHGPVTSV